MFGAPGRIRTCDPQIRNLVLYPTELRAPLSHVRLGCLKQIADLTKRDRVIEHYRFGARIVIANTGI